MLASWLIRVLILAVLVAAAVAAIVGEATAGVTLVGALVVALVTAEAADRRQARQLEAEQGRTSAQLLAEVDRLMVTLRYDRELADLADLRALLDAAAVALHRGDQAIGGVKIAHVQHGQSIDERDPDARREVNAAGQELDALGARLSVRLGADEDVVQAFRAAVDALLEVSGAVGWLEDDRAGETRRKHATIDAQREAYNAAARRFVSASVEYAGTRRPSPLEPS